MSRRNSATDPHDVEHSHGDQGRIPDASVDTPIRHRHVTSQHLFESLGSAVAALAIVWILAFILGLSVSFGLAIIWFALFFTIYAIVCRRNHGMLLTKDRLATLAMWTGAFIALVPLVAVIGYVIWKGASVALADFPHFFTADMSKLTATSPVTAVGAGAAIVGTLEQVAIAAILSFRSASSLRPTSLTPGPCSPAS